MRASTRLIAVAVFVVALGIAAGIALTRATSHPRAGRYQRGRVSEQGDVYPYAVYVPSSRRAGSSVPLVVVLHGCTMTADQMAAASTYNAIAEKGRFIALYPDVDRIDEGYARCWKGIWEPRADGRGTGDAGAIAEMTRAVMVRWHIDRNRVYAIGISAGAFEAAILAADYPDLYAAIGIHSGAAYMGGDPGCLAPGETPASTNALSRLALAAMGGRARIVPVIVFHGDADARIPYRCGRQAALQWLGTDDLLLARERRAALTATAADSRRAVAPGGHRYTVASYADGSGCAVVQFWTVHGMGHSWSGGSTDPSSARFSDPGGPSAAAASWAFFSRWGLAGPVRPCVKDPRDPRDPSRPSSP